jgi:hypothetical protein
MDLCLDSIAVVNRIPKEAAEQATFKIFTDAQVDYMRDFQVEWGEPVVVKKPKGISSDVTVTGQWGVVVQRIMNGTGALKVYLVQSRFMHIVCTS